MSTPYAPFGAPPPSAAPRFAIGDRVYYGHQSHATGTIVGAATTVRLYQGGKSYPSTWQYDVRFDNERMNGAPVAEDMLTLCPYVPTPDTSSAEAIAKWLDTDWSEAPAGACLECGNDDPTEGHRVCSDCLEVMGT